MSVSICPGCSRLISISAMSGGNPVANEESDQWVDSRSCSYCAKCRVLICNRCAPSADSVCPKCSGPLRGPDPVPISSYSFVPTLQIEHPEHLLAAITDTLGIKPSTAFPPRADYQTFWAHHYKVREDGDVPKFIMELVETLRPHQAFLQTIRSGGGEVHLRVDVLGCEFMKELQLPHELLQALGELGISLNFAFFGYSDV